jgi:hypothetical protein
VVDTADLGKGAIMTNTTVVMPAPSVRSFRIKYLVFAAIAGKEKLYDQ